MATQETYPARLCGPLSFATTISVLGTSEPRNPVMGSDLGSAQGVSEHGLIGDGLSGRIERNNLHLLEPLAFFSGAASRSVSVLIGACGF
jgi:hypothetical protein